MNKYSFAYIKQVCVLFHELKTWNWMYCAVNFAIKSRAPENYGPCDKHFNKHGTIITAHLITRDIYQAELHKSPPHSFY